MKRRGGIVHRRMPKRGLAALEVVLTTGLILPSLFFLLYFGVRVMSAFLSLVGTMIGSPLAVMIPFPI